ncbi:MAG: YceD family protein [Rhodocyclaceae bacterium]|nr:YceD family protein [Rhodocyclaceae bacterium]
MSRHEDQAIVSVNAKTVIDSLEFARQGRKLDGRVAVAQLERLADLLANQAGSLVFELLGERDAEGNNCLRLRVAGSLNLRCQRCLSPLPYAVDIDSRLMLVAPGGEWPDEELADDGTDAIEASRELAVLPLVEEEVLLDVPVVPRHEICGLPAATETEHRPSPFAVLAKLKNH